MTQDEKFRELITKYTEGTASAEEVAWLESVYPKWNESTKRVYSEDSLKDTDRVMWSNISERLEFEDLKVRQVNLWPRIIGVAAAVALIVLGVYFFNYRNKEILKQVQDDVVVNDIAPGKNTAIITLPDGTAIPLSDAQTGVVIGDNKLAYNDGSEVVQPSLPARGISPGGRESNTQMLTASTPRGGTYQVVLPDGTHVWLNADSKISFPVQFSGGIRKILLSGEAYFEVKKDKAHPFVVQTDKQEVTVLGTHFNISAYRDEAVVRTTLVEGSVSVARFSPIGGDGVARGGSKNSRNPLSPQGGSLPEGENRVILKPNQQSVLSGSNRIDVVPADVEKDLAWQRGDFVLKDEDFRSVMRNIGRWYDAEVVYGDGAPDDLRLLGVVSRSKNLSAVLRMMEATGKVRFRVEGRKVMVLGVK
jgi:transmembrane sensor